MCIQDRGLRPTNWVRVWSTEGPYGLAPYAKTLSSRDVYAVDIMGDAGRSEPAARITCAADMAAWLDETLEGLRIERAHLVGHSLGGFVALSSAAYLPDRVASLVLLDPLGIAPLTCCASWCGVLRFFSARSPQGRPAAGSADDCAPARERGPCQGRSVERLPGSGAGTRFGR